MHRNNDNAEEKPQIFSIKNTQSGWQMDRREFIALSTSAAAALTVSGCGSAEPEVLPTSAPQDLINACSEIKSHDSMIWSLMFHPNNRMLISGAYDDIKVWSVPEGQLLKTFSTEEARNEALAILSDRNILLSGSSQKKTISCWSFEDGSLLNTIECDSPVRSIAIDADGMKMLISGGNIYSLPEMKLISQVQAYDILAIHPDGNQMALFNSEKVIIRSLPDDNLLAELNGHESYITDLQYSPDGAFLTSRDHDGAVLVWDLSNYSLYKTIVDKSSSNFAISPDGRCIAVSFISEKVSIYSFPEGEKLYDLEQPDTEMSELAISSDGLYIAGGGHAGRVYLWSGQSGELLSCPMDLSAMAENKTKATVYQIENMDESTVSYTVPCGSEIPDGAVCTCNCVAGEGECVCVGHSSSGCVIHSNGSCSCHSYSSGGSHYWHPN